MPRYILLTFVFLGLAGYEMSGGADFQPRKQRPEPVAEAPKPEPVRVTETARQQPVTQAATLVAAPAIRRTPSQTLKDNAEAIAAHRSEQRLDQVRTSLRQGLPVFPAGTGQARTQAPSQDVQIASLQALAGSASFDSPTETTPEQPEVAEPVQPVPPAPAVQTAPEPVRAPIAITADLREITATRVNLRAGPGTDNDILARLQHGQKVEVLGDNGEGWLRLRTLPGDQVGWIAERLVGPATN